MANDNEPVVRDGPASNRPGWFERPFVRDDLSGLAGVIAWNVERHLQMDDLRTQRGRQYEELVWQARHILGEAVGLYHCMLASRRFAGRAEELKEMLPLDSAEFRWLSDQLRDRPEETPRLMAGMPYLTDRFVAWIEGDDVAESPDYGRAGHLVTWARAIQDEAISRPQSPPGSA